MKCKNCEVTRALLLEVYWANGMEERIRVQKKVDRYLSALELQPTRPPWFKEWRWRR